MGDEFYSSIKLITGEEVFALVCMDENDGDPVLVLQNPVIIKMISTGGSYGVKIKPWLQVPGDDFFVIKLNSIITMTEVNDETIIEFYNRYLEDNEEDDSSLSIGSFSGKTEVTKNMGYVSSVEDARKLLEDLYKLKDNKES
jgi:hypothetical protein